MQGILLEYAWLLVGNDKPNTPVGQCLITNNYDFMLQCIFKFHEIDMWSQLLLC